MEKQTRTKAPSSGVKITTSDAALIKGMSNRGDRQADIASYLGINQGRVNEILTGMNRKFLSVEPATEDELPPPGPYVVITRLEHEHGVMSQKIAAEMLNSFDEMVKTLRHRLLSLSEGKVASDVNTDLI